jgi:hypothetical protein
LLISKAVSFFYKVLRFKLEITSFYLWAHAGCTKSIIKRCQTQSIIATPSSIHNAINHAYATKRGGEGAGEVKGVGGASSIRPRV